LREIEEVYNKLKDEWGVVVVGLVTDASGEARKARRLFARKFPFLIVLDCYSHQVSFNNYSSQGLLFSDIVLYWQINLVVGDYFRSDSNVLKYTDLATQLITWLRSKTRILAHLPLSVLRAVLTRWTAHYVAYRRLLQLYPSLKGLVLSDLTKPDAEKVLVSGDSAAKRKAREMVAVIENPSFWHNIAL
jgi:hypothetical protein